VRSVSGLDEIVRATASASVKVEFSPASKARLVYSQIRFGHLRYAPLRRDAAQRMPNHCRNRHGGKFKRNSSSPYKTGPAPGIEHGKPSDRQDARAHTRQIGSSHKTCACGNDQLSRCCSASLLQHALAPTGEESLIGRDAAAGRRGPEARGARL